MISVLMMAVNAIAGIFISALKAFFSMLTWFLKACSKVIKLFFCVLPVTAVCFFILLCINIFLLFGGNFGFLAIGAPENSQISMPHSFDMPNADINIPDGVMQEANDSFNRNNYVVTNIFNDLKTWWNESVYIYKGSPLYVFLLILTILMFIPVITVLLSISVLMSFNKILFVCIIADAVIYVLRAMIGKSFVVQALDRYYRLFPEAGKRHYEKDYEKWLRNREYEDDNELRRKKKKMSSFYDDDYEDDEEYDDDYYEDSEYDDEEYYEDDEYGDEEYDEDEYDDEDYDEDEYDDEDYDEEIDDEDYDDDFSNTKDRKRSQEIPQSSQKSSFDFFAGCTSRESIDKKYRSLVKLYHPDNMDGDTAALQEINVQYDQAKKRFPLT